ncbi:MAG: PAS domain S-box protein [Thermodesulfobacteriota bacterium]|nr:PAS domain S-box protein [Thermodesulfobacteriota bacterium]
MNQRTMYLVSGLFILLILCFLVSGGYLGYRINKRHSILIYAAMETKLAAAEAHLWLEEIISGDIHESIVDDVFSSFETADWYAAAIIRGGQTDTLDIQPVRNPTVKTAFENVRLRLKTVQDMAKARLSALPADVAGSAKDQSFDIVFNEFLMAVDRGVLLLRDVLQQQRVRYLWIEMLLLAGVIAGGVGWFAVLRYFAKNQQQIRQQLQENAEHLRATLSSIGDAVIVTDTESCIIMINAVAEQLTGWPRPAALGRPLTDVFEIVNANTREPCENPVNQVLETGKVVGLANHTMLVAKDGTTYQIADSGAPVRDESGEIRGVVLVFRDVTETYQMQAILQNERERFLSVVNHIPHVIYQQDLEGRLIFANKAFQKTFNVSLAQALGKTSRDFFPKESADRYIAVDETVKREDRVIQVVEKEANPLTGREEYVDVTKVPLHNESGEVVGLQGIFWPITRAVLAEQALKESEFRLRTIFNAAKGVALVLAELQNGIPAIVEFNPGAEVLFQSSRDTMIGTRLSDLHTFESVAFLQAVAGNMKNYPEGYHCETTLRRTDDEVFPVLYAIHPIAGGQPDTYQGLLMVAIDITARKAAEKEMEHLQNYLANIIDSMPSVLMGVDKEGRITQWNHRAEKETGISAADAQGKTLAEVFPRMQDEIGRIRESIVSREVKHDMKNVVQTTDEIRYEDVTIFPLIANGVEGAVVRVDDVTERVRLEEMMIQSEKMLSVGGLAAGMAHEINNPVAGMMQNADVILRRLENDHPANHDAAASAGTTMAAIRAFLEKRGIVHQLELIHASGKQAARVVQNMLSFARKSGSQALPCSLATLIDNTIELAAHDYDLKKKYDFRNIVIDRRYDPELPAVFCEESKIQQVLLNIFRNGAEAMNASRVRTGRPETPRFIVKTSHEEDHVVIEIGDNGPGMDKQTRKRLFEPFFTTKGVGEGTGLGLSVAYFIITENHGGEMEVHSSPGNGTTFVVRLPVDGVGRTGRTGEGKGGGIADSG